MIRIMSRIVPSDMAFLSLASHSCRSLSAMLGAPMGEKQSCRRSADRAEDRMKNLLHWLLLVFLWPLLAGSAVAQQAADTEAAAFPTRALKIVVPFPAGGPSDVLARMIGQKMSEDWGRPVVIENRVGANTVIGAQA